MQFNNSLTYTHDKCGTKTYALKEDRNKETLYCCGCGTFFKADGFTWNTEDDSNTQSIV